MNANYSDSQIEQTIKRLQNILPDQGFSNGSLFKVFRHSTITNDFTRKSIKRINVADVKFLDCQFNGAAATGSKFLNGQFINCDLSGSNFQYCQFERVIFSSKSLLKGANFSHSTFVDCQFVDISLFESTLYDCSFENCLFEKSTIRTSTWENSTFKKCRICIIDLSHINLEYIKIENITLDQVVLPPYQIPYIIGAPTLLQKTKNTINVYTDKGTITAQEYCELYNDLLVFFGGQSNFFPAANLLIAQEEYDAAFDFIMMGIQEAGDFCDFRMIKHYCRLACSTREFSSSQLKRLFDLITGLAYNNTWDINSLHYYLLNVGEIKELLLNNSIQKERVEFIIKTNIEKNDLTSINDLYNQVAQIIKECCSISHVDSIELRHNSPYEIFVTCIDDLTHVLLLISTMYSILMVGNKGLDFLKKIEETIRIHQQNRMFKYELEEKKLDLEKKRNEQQTESKKTGSIQNYSVLDLEYYIRCDSIESSKKLGSDLLHNKASNPKK